MPIKQSQLFFKFLKLHKQANVMLQIIVRTILERNTGGRRFNFDQAVKVERIESPLLAADSTDSGLSYALRHHVSSAAIDT
jgi:hypothetical protein